MNKLAIIYTNNFGENLNLDFCFVSKVKKNFDKIILACGSSIDVSGRKKVEELGIDLVVGDFLGKVSMWHYTIKEYVGFDACKEFDQILLVSLDAFYGENINASMFSELQSENIDVLEIKACSVCDDTSDEKDASFIVFNNRPINDPTFIKFWDNPAFYSDSISSFFERVGFQCHTYLSDDLTKCTIVDKQSVCKMKLTDLDTISLSKINYLMENIDSSCKQDLYKFLVANNSYEVINNIFNLSFFTNKDELINANSFKHFITVFFVENIDGANALNTCEISDYNSAVIYINEEYKTLLKSEYKNIVIFSEKNVHESWNEIKHYISESCEYVLFKIVDSDPFNVELITRGIQTMEEHDFLGAINYECSLLNENYINKLIDKEETRKTLEADEIISGVNVLENAILCKADILQSVNLDNVEIVKLLPYYLQKQGIIVGKLYDCDIETMAYKAANYLEVLFSMGVVYKAFSASTINEVIVQEGLLHDQYSKNNAKIKKLQSEREKLKKQAQSVQKSDPIIQEVPVVVDIGVKGALKNWIKKVFKRGDK